MSSRPNLLVNRVTDLVLARVFYEALGLDFELEKHGHGPEHPSHAKSGFVFELYPRRSGSDLTSTIRLGFSVACLASVLSRLKDIGAEIISKPKESKWGLRAVVRDPDGHSVELLEAVNGAVEP